MLKGKEQVIVGYYFPTPINDIKGIGRLVGLRLKQELCNET